MDTSRLRHRIFAIMGSAMLTVVMLVSSAPAAPLLRERFHTEGVFPQSDLCGVVGLNVETAFVADGSLLARAKGKAGLAYFLEHLTETGVTKNLANGKTVTQISRVINHDLKVTDNGDGTLTILAMSTGNDVLYDSKGKVIARNPGQTRVEILLDHGGTPTDPFDDEFLAFLGVVKDSTGRNDDFCAAAVKALT